VRARSPRDAVVVGGGIAGLAAAWDLRSRDVLVLEASDRVGGRIRSEARDPYWLNVGAHVFSGPGSATGRLADEVGVRLEPVPGKLVALELGGTILLGGRPELYPFRLPLKTSERLALVHAGARLRLAARRYEKLATSRPGESPAETRARVLSYGDDRTFAEWLGALPGDADALFRATVTRSTAEPEEISFGHGAGYFALVWSAGKGLSHNILGGASLLVDGIASALPGGVETGAEVRRVSRVDDLLRVSYTREGAEREVLARHVVVATKAFDAARIVEDLPGETRTALDGIPYGPTVVMGMLTGERGPMPWDDLYALATPKRSFSMLFNMANVLRPKTRERRDGGSLMVYRSGHAAHDLLERSDAEIERAFVDDLEAIYPETRGIVCETLLLRLPRMLPYVAPGRAALQPALERSLGNVHLAGDYIGGVYTETAISTGQQAAAAIVASLNGPTSQARSEA
jgi:oxygen-dependent protoporphyrinogen oxidase